MEHEYTDEWRVDTHKCIVCDRFAYHDDYLDKEGVGAFLVSFKSTPELGAKAYEIIKMDDVVFRVLLDAHSERQKLREQNVALSWAASGGEDMGQ